MLALLAIVLGSLLLAAGGDRTFLPVRAAAGLGVTLVSGLYALAPLLGLGLWLASRFHAGDLAPTERLVSAWALGWTALVLVGTALLSLGFWHPAVWVVAAMLGNVALVTRHLRGRRELASVLAQLRDRSLDAGTVVFNSVHPRYSYVRMDPQGFVLEAAEKNPISSDAMAGIHWFARGCDFVRAAKQTIRKDASVDGIYFVSPTLNELVLEQALIGVRRIESRHYHPLKNRRNQRSMGQANVARGLR